MMGPLPARISIMAAWFRKQVPGAVGIAGVFFFNLFPVFSHVVFVVSVGGLSFEEQEPGADRTVTVFKAGGHETVFHEDHLGADFGRHGIGGTSVPDRIPGTTLTFTHGPGPEDVNHAAAGHDHGFAFEDVGFVFPDAETNGAADLVGVGFVGQQLDDENTLVDVVHAQGVLGGFGHDHFVGLTVDHALPTAGTAAFAAVFQQGQTLVTSSLAVDGVAFVIFLPDRQTPILEVMYILVDVGADAVDQVFTDDAHEVGAHHVDVIGNLIFRANVGVDGGQTHGHGAGTIQGGFINQGYFQAGRFGPGSSFNRGTAAGHTTAHQQEVGFYVDHFRFRTKRPFTKFSFQSHISNSSLHFRYSVGLLSAGRTGEEAGFLEASHIGGQGFALEAIDGTFSRGPDGEFEPFQGLAIPELDGPHDGVGAAQRNGAGAQGHDVGVVADFDGLLGADFNAVVAFPALFRFLVDSLFAFGIQDHQVIGADVLASGLVQRFTTVTFFGNYITGHSLIPPKDCIVLAAKLTALLGKDK